MSVANPREVLEYELNPLELQIRNSDGISKGQGAAPLAGVKGQRPLLGSRWYTKTILEAILKKGRLSPFKVLRFALDIAKQV
ncbi:hypothetical protein Tco_1257468 [Tanacetum coccineum]